MRINECGTDVSAVRILLLGIAVAGLTYGCAPRPQDEQGLVNGGGTIIPWNAQARMIGARTFVSAVVGFSTVEVITVSDESATSTPLKSPPNDSQCVMRAPMALALADLNGSHERQLVVQDGCGNWAAARSGPTSFTPFESSAIERTSPSLYIEALGGGTMLAMGNDRVIEVFAPQQNSEASIPLFGASVGRKVTNIFAEMQDTPEEATTTLLAQHREALSLILLKLSKKVDVQNGPLLEQQVTPPYLRPFDSYDFLQDSSVPGCPRTAIGVGLFDLAAGPVPRRLQVLTFDDAMLESGRFSVVELDDVADVVGVAKITLPQDSEFSQVMGALHRVKANYRFSIFGRVNCVKWMRLDTADIDFSIRTPPTPAWGEVKRVPVTDHVVLLGAVQSGGAIEFYHYDGYDVRIVSATPDRWTLKQRIENIHAERTDLSFQ